MNLTKTCIRRRVALSMASLAVVGFGVFSLLTLKVALTPDLDFPMVIVMTSYSGVPPQDMETLVTRPIEEAVSSTENLENVTSQSSNGVSMVMLEFGWNTDMDQAETDVRNNIDFARDFLPEDADEPLVIAINPSMMPIMVLTVSSENLGLTDLRRLAEEKIEPHLERIGGVSSVTTMGGLERQINIHLDPALLASHGLSPQNVYTAVQRSAGLFAAGTVRSVAKEYNLRVFSEYNSLAQIENVVVSPGAGEPVKVGDVAQVQDSYREVTDDVRVNGRQSIAMLVAKQSDANTVSTAQGIQQSLPSLQGLLPEGAVLSILRDESGFISSSIGNLSMTVMIAFLVVILVIYFFLRDWRSSSVMAVSMPVSVLGTFGVLMLADLTLNIISMAGLALAVGMLVDNSIVVLENIFRHREAGEANVAAAEKGTLEVGTAISASTLTTICVFLPVLFVPGITGKLFKDMVLTVVFSLSVSLIVAITLVPMMSSVLLKTDAERKRIRRSRLNKAMGVFLERVAAKYSAALHWALSHKKTVLGFTAGALLASILCVPLLGGGFMPQTDQGQISLSIEAMPGITLEQLRTKVMAVERILGDEVPEVENAMFRFGGGEAGPMSTEGNEISARIVLRDAERRGRSQKQIEKVLRRGLNEIPGITYNISGGKMTGSGEGDIEVKFLGNDMTVGRALAEQTRERMAEIKGLVDLQLNMKAYVPQLSVHLNQSLLNEYGLNHLQVAYIISTAIHGNTAARYREHGDEHGIFVRLAEPYRRSTESVGEILIPIAGGHVVPLRQIADIEETESPQTIYRENEERYVAVTCNLQGTDLSSARAAVDDILDNTIVPSNFSVVIGGTAEDQRESNLYLMLAFLAAVVLVYMVMAGQFESLVDPLIIMFTVPLSIIGVILALVVTGTTLNVMSLIGVVMLVGIVVNNGIVLVDHINQERDRGLPLYEAIEKGGAVRFRPVLMTAATTVFGMLPLAVEIGSGSEMWAPLARAVIGGLTTSTVLTLVLIPVMYCIFEEWGAKIKAFFAGRATNAGDNPVPPRTV